MFNIVAADVLLENMTPVVARLGICIHTVQGQVWVQKCNPQFVTHCKKNCLEFGVYRVERYFSPTYGRNQVITESLNAWDWVSIFCQSAVMFPTYLFVVTCVCYICEHAYNYK